MSAVGEVEIRPFRAEDRAGFERVVSSVLSEFGFQLDEILDTDLVDPAARYAAIWVAVHESVVVGTLALRSLEDGRSAELKRMFLLPPYRGQGNGRSLLQHALSWARDAGFEAVVLDTSPAMAVAQHLYESVGFVRTGTRTEQGARDSRSEILYELRLAPEP